MDLRQLKSCPKHFNYFTPIVRGEGLRFSFKYCNFYPLGMTDWPGSFSLLNEKHTAVNSSAGKGELNSIGIQRLGY